MILRLVDGESLGTRFSPAGTRLESRKRWMLSQPTKGKIIVDAGARSALRRQHRSLLPAGIADVQGAFGRGDIVSIVDTDGNRVGCGIANYDSVDTQQIRGCRSDKIPEILGHHYGDEVVHRDNLTMI